MRKPEVSVVKAGKHIRVISAGAHTFGFEQGGCRECATSCQSACKTSCTVSNVSCRNSR